MLNMEEYKCSKCKIVKPISEFAKANDRASGHKSQCKDCCKEYRKTNKEKIAKTNAIWAENNNDIIKEKKQLYYQENKDVILTSNKKWRDDNKEYCSQKSKEYYLENKEDIIERCIVNNRVKYKTDRIFRIKDSIRKSIKRAFKNRSYIKGAFTTDILGCSSEEFKTYIESKFEDWMSWDNYGLYNGELNYGWDLDHIIPITSAKTEEDIYRLNHYTNFQPLCSFTNRNIKKGKYETEI